MSTRDGFGPEEIAMMEAAQAEAEAHSEDIKLDQSQRKELANVLTLINDEDALAKVVSFLILSKAKLRKAMELLDRTADYVSDNPPCKDWFRDYFLLTGQHMILTDEGWQVPSAAKYYLEEDAEWEPDDEVNAPLVARGTTQKE